MKVSQAKLIASICLESYADFVQEFWSDVPGAGTLQWGWYLQYICNELQEVAERVFRGEPLKHDLINNMPTSTGKSMLHSVLFPAWIWARMPEACICGASYSETLAIILSLKCRDVIKSDKYQACFPEVRIREDQDNKSHFMTTRGGMRYAVGSGGTLQGLHFQVIVLDDPIDPNRVVSEAELATTNSWIRQTLSGRKKDKITSVTILVMQRLHMNDPTADMLLANRKVKHNRIPADTNYTINPPELASHYVGGLMDPVRLPRDVLESEKQKLGEVGYACQYGQNPVPASGGMFKVGQLRFGRPPEKFVSVVRAWDKACTPAKGTRFRGPAYTVGAKLGKDFEGRIWVLDVVRVRIDTAARERLIKRVAFRDTRAVQVGIEVEPGSGGQDSALATLRRLLGYRVRLVKASGSKEVRADEFSVAVNGGMVHLPVAMRDGNSWVGWAKDYVEELTYFPASTFCDQTDASSLAFSLLVRRRRRIGPIPKRNRAPTSGG